MKPAALLLSILFSILPSSAQQLAQEKPPEKCVVEGTVVAAATGEPLKKARLALMKAESRDFGRDRPYTASSDASGRFLLREVEPGRYRLRVERDGYVGQEYGERRSGRMWERRGAILTLLPGQKLGDIVFRMIPAAVITGRVYDTDGEPLPGARVTALRYGYSRGQRQLLPEEFAQTNDLGEYRIYGLPPGSYYVSALYTENQRWITGRIAISGEGAETNEGYVPTYYPGTSNESQAVPLEVRPGDELRGIDFALLAARAVRIRGRVFNTITGKPGRGVMLWLTSTEPMGRFPFDRDFVQEDDGTFELRGVQPGSYVLMAQWMQENKRYTARQEVEVGSTDIEGISLVIGPGIEILGRLRVEGAAVSGGAGSAEKKGEQPPDITEYRIWLEPRVFVPLGQASATVKADGAFVLENVAADDYEVRVFNAPPEAFVKSARLGGEDVLEEGLRVTGPVRGTLEVVVSLNGAVVDGAVTKDGQAFSGATVALVPEGRRRERPQLFKTTTTDQYGRYTLRGISPGEYKVFAWEGIEPGAYQDPAFLRSYEEQGQEVRLTEGSRTTLELKLIPASQEQ